MAYDKFHILKSTAVPLPIENVDTDQIIPARFLKATERVGFGDNLFRDWRFNSDNSLKDEFILNNPNYNGKILVEVEKTLVQAPRNMLLGPFMIMVFDVVSSFFADIFKNNCLNIGVLPVKVSNIFLEKIFSTIKENPTTTLTIDLPKQIISIDATDEVEQFEINPYKKAIC